MTLARHKTGLVHIKLFSPFLSEIKTKRIFRMSPPEIRIKSDVEYLFKDIPFWLLITVFSCILHPVIGYCEKPAGAHNTILLEQKRMYVRVESVMRGQRPGTFWP